MIRCAESHSIRIGSKPRDRYGLLEAMPQPCVRPDPIARLKLEFVPLIFTFRCSAGTRLKIFFLSIPRRRLANAPNSSYEIGTDATDFENCASAQKFEPDSRLSRRRARGGGRDGE